VCKRGNLGVLLLLVWLCGHAAAAVDPTRPPAALATAAQASGAAAPLRLEAIRVQGGTRSAVINGQRVRVGARIGGARVERIDASSVTLSRDGRPERLQLGSAQAKHWKKQD